jgi:large subunit ribosomal protein L29
MSKAQKFREQSKEELEALLVDLRKELYTLVNESKQAQKFEKAHRIPETKKDVARVLTILKEKQAANKLSVG